MPVAAARRAAVVAALTVQCAAVALGKDTVWRRKRQPMSCKGSPCSVFAIRPTCAGDWLSSATLSSGVSVAWTINSTALTATVTYASSGWYAAGPDEVQLLDVLETVGEALDSCCRHRCVCVVSQDWIWCNEVWWYVPRTGSDRAARREHQLVLDARSQHAQCGRSCSPLLQCIALLSPVCARAAVLQLQFQGCIGWCVPCVCVCADLVCSRGSGAQTNPGFTPASSPVSYTQSGGVTTLSFTRPLAHATFPINTTGSTGERIEAALPVDRTIDRTVPLALRGKIRSPPWA